MRSPKEFFNTEILYRFDIVDPVLIPPIKGNYRFDLKKEDGAESWFVNVNESIDITRDSSEDVDASLEMDETSFLNLVNGSLNPQLAILGKIISYSGDLKKALLIQKELAPTEE